MALSITGKRGCRPARRSSRTTRSAPKRISRICRRATPNFHEEWHRGYASTRERFRDDTPRSFAIADFLGHIEHVEPSQIRARERIVDDSIVQPLELGCLGGPGEMNVDIATGRRPASGSASVRGPYLGLSLPNRVHAEDAGTIGGADGGCRRASRVLSDASNARAAHPPRESNEQRRTNQGLLALRASVYMAAMGPPGSGKRRSFVTTRQIIS